MTPASAPSTTRAAKNCTRAAARGPGARLPPEGLGEPPPGLERVAELLVTGGVVSAGQEQGVAVDRARVSVVLEQAEPDLLVVRVVALLHRGQSQRLHERSAVVAAVEVGARPRDTLLGLE